MRRRQKKTGPASPPAPGPVAPCRSIHGPTAAATGSPRSGPHTGRAPGQQATGLQPRRRDRPGGPLPFEARAIPRPPEPPAVCGAVAAPGRRARPSGLAGPATDARARRQRRRVIDRPDARGHAAPPWPRFVCAASVRPRSVRSRRRRVYSPCPASSAVAAQLASGGGHTTAAAERHAVTALGVPFPRASSRPTVCQAPTPRGLCVALGRVGRDRRHAKTDAAALRQLQAQEAAPSGCLQSRWTRWPDHVCRGC